MRHTLARLFRTRSTAATPPQAGGPQLTRRTLLGILAAGSALPLLPQLGCSDDGSGGGEDLLDGGAGGDGGPAPDALAAGAWASGGTASMTDKASYPDPFTAALATCAIVATTTEGPCTTATDLDREDVSEGWTGLPVRLALKVVDSACEPLVGVTVKIWHTNLEGSYSGQTPNNGMCLKDQDYGADDFFRGVQTTDAEGRVFFDTCFPGWYRGRAVHIHFQVKNGQSSTGVSQLFFPEDVTADIFAAHDEYKDAGQPDTTFANDNIMAGIPSAQRDRHIFEVSRMSDGAMLAAKVVTVA